MVALTQISPQRQMQQIYPNERPLWMMYERRSDLELEFMKLITDFCYDASRQEVGVIGDLSKVWDEVDQMLCCGDSVLGL